MTNNVGIKQAIFKHGKITEDVCGLLSNEVNTLGLEQAVDGDLHYLMSRLSALNTYRIYYEVDC